MMQRPFSKVVLSGQVEQTPLKIPLPETQVLQAGKSTALLIQELFAIQTPLDKIVSSGHVVQTPSNIPFPKAQIVQVGKSVAPLAQVILLVIQIPLERVDPVGQILQAEKFIAPLLQVVTGGGGCIPVTFIELQSTTFEYELEVTVTLAVLTPVARYVLVTVAVVPSKPSVPVQE